MALLRFFLSYNRFPLILFSLVGFYLNLFYNTNVLGLRDNVNSIQKLNAFDRHGHLSQAWFSNTMALINCTIGIAMAVFHVLSMSSVLFNAKYRVVCVLVHLLRIGNLILPIATVAAEWLLFRGAKGSGGSKGSSSSSHHQQMKMLLQSNVQLIPTICYGLAEIMIFSIYDRYLMEIRVIFDYLTLSVRCTRGLSPLEEQVFICEATNLHACRETLVLEQREKTDRDLREMIRKEKNRIKRERMERARNEERRLKRIRNVNNIIPQILYFVRTVLGLQRMTVDEEKIPPSIRTGIEKQKEDLRLCAAQTMCSNLQRGGGGFKNRNSLLPNCLQGISAAKVDLCDVKEEEPTQDSSCGLGDSLSSSIATSKGLSSCMAACQLGPEECLDSNEEQRLKQEKEREKEKERARKEQEQRRKEVEKRQKEERECRLRMEREEEKRRAEEEEKQLEYHPECGSIFNDLERTELGTNCEVSRTLDRDCQEVLRCKEVVVPPPIPKSSPAEGKCTSGGGIVSCAKVSPVGKPFGTVANCNQMRMTERLQPMYKCSTITTPTSCKREIPTPKNNNTCGLLQKGNTNYCNSPNNNTIIQCCKMGPKPNTTTSFGPGSRLNTSCDLSNNQRLSTSPLRTLTRSRSNVRISAIPVKSAKSGGIPSFNSSANSSAAQMYNSTLNRSNNNSRRQSPSNPFPNPGTATPGKEAQCTSGHNNCCSSTSTSPSGNSSLTTVDPLARSNRSSRRRSPLPSVSAAGVIRNKSRERMRSSSRGRRESSNRNNTCSIQRSKSLGATVTNAHRCLKCSDYTDNSSVDKREGCEPQKPSSTAAAQSLNKSKSFDFRGAFKTSTPIANNNNNRAMNSSQRPFPSSCKFGGLKGGAEEEEQKTSTREETKAMPCVSKTVTRTRDDSNNQLTETKREVFKTVTNIDDPSGGKVIRKESDVVIEEILQSSSAVPRGGDSKTTRETTVDRNIVQERDKTIREESTNTREEIISFSADTTATLTDASEALETRKRRLDLMREAQRCILQRGTTSAVLQKRQLDGHQSENSTADETVSVCGTIDTDDLCTTQTSIADSIILEELKMCVDSYPVAKSTETHRVSFDRRTLSQSQEILVDELWKRREMIESHGKGVEKAKQLPMATAEESIHETPTQKTLQKCARDACKQRTKQRKSGKMESSPREQIEAIIESIPKDTNIKQFARSLDNLISVMSKTTSSSSSKSPKISMTIRPKRSFTSEDSDMVTAVDARKEAKRKTPSTAGGGVSKRSSGHHHSHNKIHSKTPSNHKRLPGKQIRYSSLDPKCTSEAAAVDTQTKTTTTADLIGQCGNPVVFTCE